MDLLPLSPLQPHDSQGESNNSLDDISCLACNDPHVVPTSQSPSMLINGSIHGTLPAAASTMVMNDLENVTSSSPAEVPHIPPVPFGLSFCAVCGKTVTHASPVAAYCCACGTRLRGRFCGACGWDSGLIPTPVPVSKPRLRHRSQPHRSPSPTVILPRAPLTARGTRPPMWTPREVSSSPRPDNVQGKLAVETPPQKSDGEYHKGRQLTRNRGKEHHSAPASLRQDSQMPLKWVSPRGTSPSPRPATGRSTASSPRPTTGRSTGSRSPHPHVGRTFARAPSKGYGVPAPSESKLGTGAKPQQRKRSQKKRSTKDTRAAMGELSPWFSGEEGWQMRAGGGGSVGRLKLAPKIQSRLFGDMKGGADLLESHDEPAQLTNPSMSEVEGEQPRSQPVNGVMYMHHCASLTLTSDFGVSTAPSSHPISPEGSPVPRPHPFTTASPFDPCPPLRFDTVPEPHPSKPISPKGDQQGEGTQDLQAILQQYTERRSQSGGLHPIAAVSQNHVLDAAPAVLSQALESDLPAEAVLLGERRQSLLDPAPQADVPPSAQLRQQYEEGQRQQYDILVAQFMEERWTLHAEALRIHHEYHARVERDLQRDVHLLTEEFRAKMTMLEQEYQQQLLLQPMALVQPVYQRQATLWAAHLHQQTGTLIATAKDQVRRHEEALTAELQQRYQEMEVALNHRLRALYNTTEPKVIDIPSRESPLPVTLLVLPKGNTGSSKAASSDLMYSSSDTKTTSSVRPFSERGFRVDQDRRVSDESVRRMLSFEASSFISASPGTATRNRLSEHLPTSPPTSLSVAMPDPSVTASATKLYGHTTAIPMGQNTVPMPCQPYIHRHSSPPSC